MTAQTQHVWITRAQPGAAATARRLRARGFEPWVKPLLKVRPLAVSLPDLTDFGSLAFTSANGVRAFAALTAARDLPVMAVGLATARAARRAGFQTVQSADGDVETLARTLHQATWSRDKPILHVSASEPSGDLAGSLARTGLRAETLKVYETIPVLPSKDSLDRLGDLDFVLIHSARAAKVLADVLARRPCPNLKVLGISEAALAPLTHTPLALRAPAPLPLELALVSLLEDVS